MSIESRQGQTGKVQLRKAELSGLRRCAEHRLSPVIRPPATLAREDVEGLLYELQVHQIELDMQCKQLQQAQYETEESRNSYRELYESVPIGYATVDASGKVCDLNPAGAALLRVSTGHRLTNFHLCVAAKDLDRFDLLCRSVLASNQGRAAELTLERADGTSLSSEVGIYPVKAAAGRRLRLTFQDISARKKAEETVNMQEEQLEWDRKEFQFLTERLLRARGEERRRIAGALHDDHCQRLASCLEDIQSVIQRTESCERERIERIGVRLTEVLQDIRRFTTDLQARDGEEFSLPRSMRRYIEGLSASARLPIEFREVDVPHRLSRPVEQCMYRLLEESLDNVLKHAEANQVVVTLTGFKGGIEMRVIDDGRGFDLTEVLRMKKGMGLTSIQQRVRELEGKVVIQSRPNQGAELKIVIPTTMITPEASA
jgi:PAS domain S-box-containing protein